MKTLILTGGIAHPFDETAPELARILEAAGFSTQVTEDIEGGLARLEDVDLLAVHALRWTMTQHEKYAPHRARWAFSLGEAGRAAIEKHVARGRGVLGIHTAAICFDDWPAWRDHLGVRWVWGRSHHPAPCAISVRASAVTDPIVAGIAPFSVHDELYSDLERTPGTRVLMEARADGRVWQPVVVTSDRAGRRAAYVAFGHDMASMTAAPVRTVIARAARWAAGADPGGAGQGAETGVEGADA